MIVKATRALLLALLLPSFLTLALPNLARAQDQCHELLKDGQRAKVVDAVPAMGHLTTVSGLIGILRRGAILPFDEIKKQKPKSKKAIGGVSNSAFLAPMFKARGIRNGAHLLGPTLILSSNVLYRNDYYFNETWEGYGGYSYYSSIVAKDATEENILRSGEFMFGHEIPIADYVVGVWIPPSQKFEFELRGLGVKSVLRKLSIPIYYADSLPSLETLREMSQTKAAPVLKEKYLNNHPYLDLNIEYQFGGLEKALDYAEDPAHHETLLFNRLVKFLNAGYYRGLAKTFDLKLRVLRTLLVGGHCAPKWINTLLSSDLASNERERLIELLDEFSISKQMQEMLAMPSTELHTYLRSKFRSHHAAFEFALNIENHGSKDFQLLLLGLETGFLERDISELRLELQVIRILLMGGYRNSYVVNYTHFFESKRQRELEKLWSEFGLGTQIKL